ncbi:MAG: VWA domain-containing protein [Planctomycetaceae bacterium]|uniref:von Willebrand factor type A domain protein n=1 Tax=Lacipirellula limnantheis TaxID=2528024 RepID=A0A517TSE3_9BACT|nr:vWA domain-containing protein [Lacipirellula limnantheis]MBL9165667.1 VWA domain-containing protein [Planctomycetaceae bacterium]QDT71292.1 von Willebrand factor type A domain protein [Lacipirellula limnantheis]
MYTLIRFALAAALFCIAGHLLDWLHPVRLMLGLPAAAACGLLLAIVAWTFRPSREDIEEGLHPLRELLFGVFLGAVWIVFTNVYLAVAIRHASLSHWLDRDREHVEQVVERLEAAGNWNETTDFLNEQIVIPHSPTFTRWLVDRALVNYVRAADASANQAENLLQRASRLAQEHGLPTDYYEIQLKHVRYSARTSGVATDYEKRLAVERAARESAEQSAAERVAKLSASVRSQIKLAQNDRLRVVETLLQQAPEPRLGEVRTFAAAQITAVKPFGIATTAAERLLDDLDAHIAGILPRAFPAGTTLRLRRVVPIPATNLLVVDLLVTAPNAAVTSDIRPTDWNIAQHEKVLKRFSVQPYDDNRRLAVAIVIDCSASTHGAPLASAVQGVQQLLRRLPDGTPIWIARFSDQTTSLVNWTTAKEQAIAACIPLQAGGHTALYASMNAALDALEQRAGDELVLVAFSDGVNNKPGPEPEALIARARRRGVRIHSIALQSGQVNEQVLQQLAVETGGMSRVATQADQLGQHFQRLAEELATPCWRLMALDYDAANPCTLSFGQDPSCSVTLPATAVLPSSPELQAAK